MNPKRLTLSLLSESFCVLCSPPYGVSRVPDGSWGGPWCQAALSSPAIETLRNSLAANWAGPHKTSERWLFLAGGGKKGTQEMPQIPGAMPSPPAALSQSSRNVVSDRCACCLAAG